MMEQIKQLQATCDEKNITLRFVSGLPDFYIWLDIERNLLFIDETAAKGHITEFLKYFLGRNTEEGAAI